MFLSLDFGGFQFSILNRSMFLYRTGTRPFFCRPRYCYFPAGPLFRHFESPVYRGEKSLFFKLPRRRLPGRKIVCSFVIYLVVPQGHVRHPDSHPCPDFLLSSFLPSSFFFLQSSIFYLLSSIFCLQSSVLFLLIKPAPDFLIAHVFHLFEQFGHFI